MSLLPLDHACLVSGHKPTVANHVGGEDRGQTALHRDSPWQENRPHPQWKLSVDKTCRTSGFGDQRTTVVRKRNDHDLAPVILSLRFDINFRVS